MTKCISQALFCLFTLCVVLKRPPYLAVKNRNVTFVLDIDTDHIPYTMMSQDLGIILAGLLPFVTSFLVDSRQEFTLRKIKNGLKSTFTDHYSLEVVLLSLPRAGRGKEQE